MNHPNLPKLCFVYHTRRSYFRDKVSFDATRGFHYLSKLEREAKQAKLDNPSIHEEDEKKVEGEE